MTHGGSNKKGLFPEDVKFCKRKQGEKMSLFALAEEVCNKSNMTTSQPSIFQFHTQWLCRLYTCWSVNYICSGTLSVYCFLEAADLNIYGAMHPRMLWDLSQETSLRSLAVLGPLLSYTLVLAWECVPAASAHSSLSVPPSADLHSSTHGWLRGIPHPHAPPNK